MDLRGDRIFRALLALDNALAEQCGPVTITLPEHLALAARQSAEWHTRMTGKGLGPVGERHDGVDRPIRRSNFRIGRVVVLWARRTAEAA